MRSWRVTLVALEVVMLGVLAGGGLGVAVVQGRFVPWRPMPLLPAPAETVTTRAWRVWITTASGATYVSGYPDDCEADCWELVTDLTAVGEGSFTLMPLEHCGPMPLIGSARQVGATCEQGISPILTVYAISPNGRLWLWSSQPGEYGIVLVGLWVIFGGMIGLMAAPQVAFTVALTSRQREVRGAG